MSRLRAAEFHPDLRRVSRVLPRAAVNRHTAKLIRQIGSTVARRVPRDVTVRQVSPTSSVRLHKPAGQTANGDALLWIHGGGLVVGNAMQDDARCRQFATELGATVAAVDHRLAPEHPYPAALDDCVDAFRWLCEQPSVDPARIAIGGASAGGGLAAALALRLHEEGLQQPIFQLLLYPMLDDRTATILDQDAGVRRLWSNKGNHFGWASYLGGPPPGDSSVPPLASPARYDDLSGAPPAWIGVGTLDLFYDEDVRYAQRLTDAGVRCDLMVVPGAFHGFDSFVLNANVTANFRAAQISALRTAFLLQS